MNKIIIENNNITTTTNSNINITNNIINFTTNGEYILEVTNTNNIDINIILKDKVCIKLFIISLNNNLISNITYKLGENSNLIIQKFYKNNQIKEEENIYLDGKYSKISYNFSTIANNQEQYKMKIYHNNNYVTSDISNKCIGNNNSKILFDIDSILDKGNIGCIMDQDTKIISLGEIDANIKPNMYIEEDDVEARHGSVIGKFNEDDIFYLMSRGINKEESIKLLITGFILSNLSIDDENKNKIITIINNN